jgi:hypothetical protein
MQKFAAFHKASAPGKVFGLPFYLAWTPKKYFWYQFVADAQCSADLSSSALALCFRALSPSGILAAATQQGTIKVRHEKNSNYKQDLRQP